MDQFNHNTIERDIERLSKEIAEKKELPEYKEISEKELIKQALQPMIKPAAQSSGPAVQPAVTDEERFLPDYLNDSPAETKLQVEKLIGSVFQRGIEKTVKEAKNADPFILDAFHDALVDKLHEELKRRKLI